MKEEILAAISAVATPVAQDQHDTAAIPAGSAAATHIGSTVATAFRFVALAISVVRFQSLEHKWPATALRTTKKYRRLIFSLPLT